MKTDFVEPGLLSVFRLLTGVRFGITITGLASFLMVAGAFVQPPIFVLWFGVADAAFLLAYLSWPPVQRLMGRAFLPIGLLLASVGPVTEQYFFQRDWSGFGISVQQPAGMIQVFLLLFVPLVLIGWQYNFRMIILFSLGTAFLDWFLIGSLVDFTSLRIIPVIGVLFIRTITFILVGYMVVRLMANQRQQRRALAEANSQLAHYATTLEQLATSRERNRLARELHDTLAHSLSGVAVQLEAVKTLWENSPQESRTMLEQSLATTRNGLTETRRALQALRATPLEDLGLALAIHNLAESVTSRKGLALDMDLPERLENLSPDVEQGIYRVAQEALENVIQHAEARNVKLRISQANGSFAMTISDDGRGFDPESVDLIHQFGLQGMRERTEMLGGQLEMVSQPGNGTTISLTWGERT